MMVMTAPLQGQPQHAYDLQAASQVRGLGQLEQQQRGQVGRGDLDGAGHVDEVVPPHLHGGPHIGP